MNRFPWLTALLTAGALFAVAAAAGLAYIYSGAYNVGATDDIEPLGRFVFSTTTEESIQAHAEAPLNPPLNVTGAMVQSGARRYKQMCVMCHGAPGVEPAWLGRPEAMKPNPPRLSRAVQRFSDAELHWIVTHGIKHSGMPAMAPTHDEEAIREVVAFIKQLPEMSPQEYQAMGRSGGGAGAASDSSHVQGGGHGGPGHSH